MAQNYTILADCSVHTRLPVVPARHEDRILWPVGEFTTTLWWPEIEALIRSNQVVAIQRTWLYRKAPALKQWAQWTLAELYQANMMGNWWVGILLKHWSRTLIGRFATQYQQWELLGRDCVSDVRSGMWYDNVTETLTEFMQVGRDMHVMTGLTESDDSCPQITSYIMSAARAQLWTAMVAVGLSNVLYVDTDSIVVNTQGNARLRGLTSQGMFDGLRLKSRALGYEIYGPRSAIIGASEKFAGIPRDSLRIGDDQYRGEVWTQLERALRIGEHNRVSIQPRTFTVRWNEHRRARTADGTTVPYRLPDYQPSQPTGDLPPVTEKEWRQRFQRQLNAKRAATG